LNCGIKVNSCLGVLWLGNSVIPGSPDVISHLQKIGKRVFYVTNNSSKTREEFVSKCSRLGYPASKVSVSFLLLS
jgi:phosphoglycolate phosphatase